MATTKLTDDKISRLKPDPNKNLILYDSDPRGFGVRVSRAGVKSYILNYRIAGRIGTGKDGKPKPQPERRITIGRVGEKSLDQARQDARDYRTDIEKGIDPIAEKERKTAEALAEPTVKELADDYLERHARPHKRPTSIRDDEYMLDGIVRPQLATRKVSSINRRDIEAIHGSLAATPYKANRLLSLLSKMFGLAVEWGWRADNPAKGIPKFDEEPRKKYLTTAELKRLLRALAKHPRKESAKAISLLIYTGARRGEVLSAKWEQFDLKRGVWTKPSSHTKQKRTEHVPLNRGAIRLLKSMKRKDEYLFPSRGTDGHLMDVKTIWHSVCKTAKLTGVRLHDVRHSFASHLVSKGVSLQMVGKLLGHSSPQTTARYAHLADDPLREATNKFPKLT